MYTSSSSPRWMIFPLLVLELSATRPAPVASYPFPCPGVSIRIGGMIRGPDGRPLSGARVVYLGPDLDVDCLGGRRKEYVAFTDRKGTYSILAPNGAYPLWVEHPDHATYPDAEYMRRSDMAAGEIHADHQFELLRVQVRVVGPHGLPVPKGVITYYPDPGGAAICGTGLPEAKFADGSVEVLLHRPGRYIFSTRAVDSQPGIPTVWPSIPVSRDTTIQITLGSHAIRGTIRGEDSHPLGGAHVVAYGRAGSSSAYTDSVGRYELFLPSGSYRWMIEAPGLDARKWAPPGQVEVEEPRTFDIGFSGVEWSGTVRDAKSKETLDSIRAYVYEHGTGGAFNPTLTLTGPDGRFHIAVLKGVRFDLELYDSRIEGVKTQYSPDFDENQALVLRKHARVNRKGISDVAAVSDSTFEILMDPVDR